MLESFFSPTYIEPFRLFSTSHVLVLLLFSASTILLYAYRHSWYSETAKRVFRYMLACLLLLTEVSFQLWSVWTDTWSVAHSLPLQLCSISLLLCVIMLCSKSFAVYEIAFFTGLGGAAQAMLTPELAYPFAHFRFFHFFLAHSAILWACLYMTWVEGYRPRLCSVWKSIAFLNLLLLIVLPVNKWSGGNYMFVSHKPENPSLLDYLGDYPWYLLSLEGVALAVFLLLYLPFARANKASADYSGQSSL
ncbi:TIGR02206 family membrane protein [Brevibacillus sp. TJ4]|uniref:YwaF family protein n=1 Tax=Brevibacillus sp. TJ4 TaxID=3234853 RepID=UPI0037CFC87A